MALAISVILYGAEVWVLKEEEWERLELTYNELMRKISRHQRRKRIWERGFDKEDAFKVRKELGLPSVKQVVVKKRLNFYATVLLRVNDRKVFRVMEEEEEVKGEWWKLIQKDMSQCGIADKQYLLEN